MQDEPYDTGDLIAERHHEWLAVELAADDIIERPMSHEELLYDIFGESDSDEEEEKIDRDETKEFELEEDEASDAIRDEIVTDNEEAENNGVNEDEIVGEEVQQRYNLRRSSLPQGHWRGAAVTTKREFGLQMTIREGIEKTGDDAVRSFAEEVIKQHKLDTYVGVHLSALTLEQKKGMLPSKSFLKEKFLSTGEYQRTRARLVAGGHRQDRTVFDKGGSPTVATQSVFMIAAIAAAEGKSVATVDFPSAFLNCVLPDDYPPIFMRLGKFESMILAEYDPSYRAFMNPDGTIVVRLKRGLYGCVESARLWYDHISGNLEKLGFVRNKSDICVFNRRESDWSLTTIVLHVDDMMITAVSEEALDRLIAEVECVYPGLSINRGRVFNYLGMTFDFETEGKAKVTMNGYVNELLEEYDLIAGVASTPAGNNLFAVSDSSPTLLNVEKDKFHSLTAKLLYLSKRVRPDILTAISFLSKRVLTPTEQDKKKLERVLKYIRGTKDKGIVLEAGKCLSILAYIDSSYGVHMDMRSHTGCVIGLGLGPIYAKSSGQKINTKSSTEAELVGLSDSTGQVVWTRNFLLEQGYDVGPATIYQDNMSTIALVKNGSSNSARTRHIAIRYFFISDRVNSGEIKIEYMQTGDMLADILTKPLQGNLFYKLRDRLLNWYE